MKKVKQPWKIDISSAVARDGSVNRQTLADDVCPRLRGERSALELQSGSGLAGVAARAPRAEAASTPHRVHARRRRRGFQRRGLRQCAEQCGMSRCIVDGKETNADMGLGQSISITYAGHAVYRHRRLLTAECAGCADRSARVHH